MIIIPTHPARPSVGDAHTLPDDVPADLQAMHRALTQPASEALDFDDGAAEPPPQCARKEADPADDPDVTPCLGAALQAWTLPPVQWRASTGAPVGGAAGSVAGSTTSRAAGSVAARAVAGWRPHTAEPTGTRVRPTPARAPIRGCNRVGRRNTPDRYATSRTTIQDRRPVGQKDIQGRHHPGLDAIGKHEPHGHDGIGKHEPRGHDDIGKHEPRGHDDIGKREPRGHDDIRSRQPPGFDNTKRPFKLERERVDISARWRVEQADGPDRQAVEGAQNRNRSRLEHLRDVRQAYAYAGPPPTVTPHPPTVTYRPATTEPIDPENAPTLPLQGLASGPQDEPTPPAEPREPRVSTRADPRPPTPGPAVSPPRHAPQPAEPAAPRFDMTYRLHSWAPDASVALSFDYTAPAAAVWATASNARTHDALQGALATVPSDANEPDSPPLRLAERDMDHAASDQQDRQHRRRAWTLPDGTEA